MPKSPVSCEWVADGDVALDGEGDGAVDGAHQRHVDHLREEQKRNLTTIIHILQNINLSHRQHVGEEVQLDVVPVVVDEHGEGEEQDGADDVELKRRREGGTALAEGKAICNNSSS